MSADNWTKCPRCGREENLREDYEIGIYLGKFHIDYHAECGYEDSEGCGYRFHFETEIDPMNPKYLKPGRVFKPTMPEPIDPEKVQRELRERVLARMTPEERAAFKYE
jgi:hypothetical protein